MEDKLVDYFNKMLEMEEAKRDAIINLKHNNCNIKNFKGDSEYINKYVNKLLDI